VGGGWVGGCVCVGVGVGVGAWVLVCGGGSMRWGGLGGHIIFLM